MEVTAKNFDSIINNHDTVLVDFYAPWCSPCQMQSNILTAFAEQHPTACTIAKLDTDAEASIAQRYGISVLPTLILFAKGEEVARAQGVQTMDRLEKLVGRS